MEEVDKYTALGIDRRTGLGGSDAPAVVGLSPFQKQRWMWGYKTGKNKSPKQSDAMRVGSVLEPFLIEEAFKALLSGGHDIERADLIEGKPWVPHPEREWMRASHDVVIPKLNANLQLKTSSKPEHFGEDWSSDISEYIVPQLRHEMSIPAPVDRTNLHGKVVGEDVVEFERSFVFCAFIPGPAWKWRKAILEAHDESTAAVLELLDKLDMRIFHLLRCEWRERNLIMRLEQFWWHVKNSPKWERDFETSTHWAKEHIL